METSILDIMLIVLAVVTALAFMTAITLFLRYVIATNIATKEDGSIDQELLDRIMSQYESEYIVDEHLFL